MAAIGIKLSYACSYVTAHFFLLLNTYVPCRFLLYEAAKAASRVARTAQAHTSCKSSSLTAHRVFRGVRRPNVYTALAANPLHHPRRTRAAPHPIGPRIRRSLLAKKHSCWGCLCGHFIFATKYRRISVNRETSVQICILGGLWFPVDVPSADGPPLLTLLSCRATTLADA